MNSYPQISLSVAVRHSTAEVGHSVMLVVTPEGIADHSDTGAGYTLTAAEANAIADAYRYAAQLVPLVAAGARAVASPPPPTKS